MVKERILERDGYVWCYELTSERLRLKLFRAIPLGSISLRNVVYIRQRSSDDLAGLLKEVVLKPFRTWYWPHPAVSRHPSHSTPYVIRTRRGTHVFVRLRSSFHYRLRAAIGAARAHEAAPALERVASAETPEATSPGDGGA